MSVLLFIGSGVLALNMTLEQVADTRRTQPTDHIVTQDDTECMIGVPFGYAQYINEHAMFFHRKERRWYGPFLIVDVEHPDHSGIMRTRGIVADINCPKLVHEYGGLYVRRSKR